MTPTQALSFLIPELVLLGSALVVLALDLIWRDDEGKKNVLPWLALVGLAGALAATLNMMGLGETLVWNMVAVDAFAVFFKTIAIVATGFVILASLEYTKGRTPYRGEFYGLLLIATLAISLAVAASDLIMIYLSIEFLSITSYVLVGYLRDDAKSNEAAIKYFLFGAVSSGVMLYGMSLLYGATGTTNLAGIAAAFVGQASPILNQLALPSIFLLLAGFGFKAALVPFHWWAPDTYEGAPTPITAFLAVASKATGFAILSRVFLTALPYFAWDWAAILLGMSAVSMTVGNLIALRQTNIKRMLAYSSIAHAGYILIGVAASLLWMLGELQVNGLDGVLLYLFTYLFTTLGAFLVVIAVENAIGSNEIEDYAGLISRAPLAAGLLIIFLMSLAGIPPTAGFIGKFFLFGAAIKTRLFWYYIVAAIGVVNSVVSVYYYFNVARYVLFVPAKDESAIKLPLSLTVPLVLTAVMTLLICLYPSPFITWATQSVQMLATL